MRTRPRPHARYFLPAMLGSVLAGCALAPTTPSPAMSTAAPVATPAPAPQQPVPQAPLPADLQRQAAFNKSLESWHGASIQELQAKLGAPDSRDQAGDGRLVYVYKRAAKAGSFACVVRYLIDEASGRISGHQIEGC